MGVNHIAEQLRNWSPGQAMLPPDPGGLNRALDRVAAEHLREVAPGLAPDASGYPFLSDERPPAPAPPAEATREQPCACAGHREPGDPLICRKRYSEMLEAIYEDDYGDMAELRDALLRHDLALRTRAREAEEREAKWRRELSAACELSERAREIVITALNQPPEHFYDKHDNGEWSAEHAAFAIRSLFRERDEAREQRDALSRENKGLRDQRDAISDQREDLANEILVERAARGKAEAERDEALTESNDLRSRIERLVAGAATLTERAEEAEEEVRLADFRVRSAESRADGLRTRLAAAEAEVKRLRSAYDDPTTDATDGAHPAWWRGSDAGVAGAVRIVTEALDEPLPLVGCVGGADLESVRQRVAALRARAQRLVEAGDAMASGNLGLADMRARWAAAKADAPAAGGGR